MTLNSVDKKLRLTITYKGGFVGRYGNSLFSHIQEAGRMVVNEVWQKAQSPEINRFNRVTVAEMVDELVEKYE